MYFILCGNDIMVVLQTGKILLKKKVKGIGGGGGPMYIRE